MEQIDVKGLRALLATDDAPLLIDVRTSMEFASGHVPEARSYPLGAVGSRAGELKNKGKVYVICASGNRSVSACQQLAGQGLKVVNVKGGTSAWSSQGYPVKRERSLLVFVMPAAAALLLGLAPFSPEPHIVGKLRWVAGGAVGMGPMDWFDLVLHGAPWLWLAWTAVSYVRTPKD